jgi:hypothetical protein
VLSEVEICDQQCMGRDIGSERDYKIIRHKQKFETTEFDLCGLHCSFINLVVAGNYLSWFSLSFVFLELYLINNWPVKE